MKNIKENLLIVVLGVFLLFSIGLNIVLLNDLKDTVETATVKEKVARHILVTSENPTIAEIKDIEELKATNPLFYQNAKNGDKVLAYSDKVVIYRESEDIIVNVSPVDRTRTIEKDINE